MIYLKKVEVSSEVFRLIIKIHRAPVFYTKTFLDEISGTDHPLMVAIATYGFVEPISFYGEWIEYGLSDEGWEFWRQVIAIARSDPRGKGSLPSETKTQR